MEGIHYWEIVADARTEHELKIGVSSVNDMSPEPDQIDTSRTKNNTVEVSARSENEAIKVSPTLDKSQSGSGGKTTITTDNEN